MFDLAIAQPGTWAALWPVDPARVPPADPGLPVWLSSGEVSRYSARAFIERLYLVSESDAAHAGDRVYVDAGEDHMGTARRAYRDPRVHVAGAAMAGDGVTGGRGVSPSAQSLVGRLLGTYRDRPHAATPTPKIRYHRVSLPSRTAGRGVPRRPRSRTYGPAGKSRTT